MTNENKEPIQANSTDSPHEAGTTPDKAEAQNADPKFVRISTKAIIEWSDLEGNVTSTGEGFRSLSALSGQMSKILEGAPDRAQENVEIYLNEEPVEGATTPEQQVRRVIVKGKLVEVVEYLKNRAIEPAAAVAQLQTTVGLLCDMSSLQAIILTAVFDEAGATGFGLVSESTEITDECLILLGASAANQADMFKDAMRKRGLEFPDDSSIIVPGQVRGDLKSIIGG